MKYSIMAIQVHLETLKLRLIDEGYTFLQFFNHKQSYRFEGFEFKAHDEKVLFLCYGHDSAEVKGTMEYPLTSIERGFLRPVVEWFQVWGVTPQ